MSPQELLNANGIRLDSYKLGKHYATCPKCSAKRSKEHQKTKCLGIKIDAKGACWRCNHCKWKGPGKGDGKSGGDGKWTTLAEFIYRDKDNKPFLKVRKCLDPDGERQFPQYHWDGKAWAKGKPSVEGKPAPKIPYRLPQLLAAPLSATIYFCEGEKDCETLGKLGFVATTASEGATAKWDPALTPYFKDRHVVILPHADEPGRKHGRKVAKAINGVAASVRMLELYPERQDGFDVSNWIADDTAGAKLAQMAKEAPLWEPDTDDGEDEDEDDADIEITRLAQLSLLEYAQQRKAAAKKLGDIPVTMLDKVVQAERERLGLDGDDDGKQGHAISFPEPEPWPEPVNGAELLNGIAAAVRTHVVMSDHGRDTTALWTLHAYLIDRFLVSPRLGVRSPTKQCGKTTLFDVLGRLSPRPLSTQNVTPAVIFRVVEAHRPTLYIDEGDTFLKTGERADEMRGILNGNRKGSTVLRTVGDDHEPRAFSVYTAVAIALIGQLPDTLHDRSVEVDLKRRLRSEPITPFRPDRADHLDVLARKAAR